MKGQLGTKRRRVAFGAEAVNLTLVISKGNGCCFNNKLGGFQADPQKKYQQKSNPRNLYNLDNVSIDLWHF
jgi:hypothetical protein